jgi:type II secretory pathway pseudopilin PulG
MYNQKIKKILKKPQPNSGFTLVELLAGLIMSIFVTGALGFGLYQIMSATSAEKAKANARSEASRAIEFISDELRRAENFEANSTNAAGFNSSGKQVILALNVPELNSSSTLDSDKNATTPARIIYYLANSSGNWKGPKVLYRYGPPLNDQGKYTTNNWTYEALIDGIDNTPIANDPCETGETLNPPMTSSPSGFYACINNTSTAAQIFLTGGIDANVIAGNDSNYTSETKAVARAKDVAVNSFVAAAVAPITFRSLEADYVCHPEKNGLGDDKLWTMRTDFDNTDYDSSGNGNRPDRDDATKWVHEKNRKAQPIKIRSSADLIINSIPISSTGCINPASGNQGTSASDPLSNFVGDKGIDDKTNAHTISHTIKFQEQVTGRSNDTSYYKTFNGNTTEDPDNPGYNNPNVMVDKNNDGVNDGTVQVFKNGSRIVLGASVDANGFNVPARGYPGYDASGKSTNKNDIRPTLGEFLKDKGFAQCTANCSNDDTNDDEYTISGLEDNERILAFEIGQEDNGATVDTDADGDPQAGFDMGDNVFIMSHDAFAGKHP